MIYACAFAAQKAAGSCIKELRQQVQGGDSSPLLSSHESSPEVLHPALESSMQERRRFVGLGPEEGCKNDQRGRKTEAVGVVQYGEEEALGRPCCGLPISMVEF